jgi:hypothetical protein
MMMMMSEMKIARRIGIGGARGCVVRWLMLMAL